MYLPDDVLDIIREYSKPLTRPDWRQGSYFKRNFNLYHYLIQQISREYRIRRIITNFGFMYHAFFIIEDD